LILKPRGSRRELPLLLSCQRFARINPRLRGTVLLCDRRENLLVAVKTHE
jgi:hypothetical protein